MTKEEILNFRFGSVDRLYGHGSLKKLQGAHVAVIGLGGVGSWAVEGLVRSGLGHITLADFDDICASNFNRQIHAEKKNIGVLKTQALRQRIESINEYCQVNLIERAFTSDSVDVILNASYDYVIDAIDDLGNKCLLIKSCVDKSIPILVVGGIGGRQNPWQIQVADLGDSYQDRLLYKTRKKLRQDMGFKKNKGTLGIPCVFSDEKPYYIDDQGCATQDDQFRIKEKLNCSSGLGTTASVSASFGFAASAFVIKDILT